MNQKHLRQYSRWLLWLLVSAGLFLSGCSTISVLNDTDTDVRLIIRAPDSVGIKASSFHNNSTKTVLSLIGGSYFIAVLPDQTLINDLTIQKAKLQAQKITTDMTKEEADQINQQIFEIEQKIEAAETAAAKTKASCAGSVLEYGSVNATISEDRATGQFSLSCTVNAPKVDTGGQ
jgi:hypothetical protein